MPDETNVEHSAIVPVNLPVPAKSNGAPKLKRGKLRRKALLAGMAPEDIEKLLNFTDIGTMLRELGAEKPAIGFAMDSLTMLSKCAKTCEQAITKESDPEKRAEIECTMFKAVRAQTDLIACLVKTAPAQTEARPVTAPVVSGPPVGVAIQINTDKAVVSTTEKP